MWHDWISYLTLKNTRLITPDPSRDGSRVTQTRLLTLPSLPLRSCKMATSLGSKNASGSSHQGTSSSAMPPPKEPHNSLRTSSKIIIRRVQKESPVMMFLKENPTELGDIVADFEVGKTTGVLFLR